MADSNMFIEATEAVKKGQLDRARDLLARLLRTDQNNPDYWLWMSMIVDSQKERVYCLKNVLRLDPGSMAAKRGLVLAGEIQDETVDPVPPIRRVWEVAIAEAEELTGIQKVMANPVLRVLVFIGIGIFAVGLILVAIFGSRVIFTPRLTVTPLAWTTTPSVTPSYTPEIRTPTPTFEFTPTVQPLWMLLEATYTPAPLYVNTPHPQFEAYRLALRAYERQDYEAMLNFMQQTLKANPDAPDAHYYVGEAQRLLGNTNEAFAYYEAALEVDAEFAPAYLARALLRLALTPKADISEDLNKAIELDPQYGQAYLERAKYNFAKQEAEAALEDLQNAEELLTGDPNYYLLKARVLLYLGEKEAGLQNALQAHQRDITLLPAYLVLSQAYLENGQPAKAIENIQTYSLYAEGDALYWTLLGGALYQVGDDLEGALEALDKALEMDDEFALAYYYHGMTALALDDPKLAINDLFLARNLAMTNFDYSISFGIALMVDERYNDAYKQINASEPLAVTDDQLALHYYYKAIAADKLAQYAVAKEAFEALLALPTRVVPTDWSAEAEEYLAPPTETPPPTETSTPTLTFTITQTPSKTATSTKTLTPSVTATKTFTPTPTNSSTVTKTLTSKPSSTPTP